MNALILGILWLIYYTLHSVMADDRVKAVLGQMLGATFRYYRAFYTFFTAANFILLLWLQSLMQSPDLFTPPLALRIAAGAMVGVGVWIAGRTIFSHPLAFWLRPLKAETLITTGWYAYVRHPMYFGMLLILIGFFCEWPSVKNLVFVSISIAYLVVGSHLEERKLIHRFGDAYVQYRRRVKMLVPFVF